MERSKNDSFIQEVSSNQLNAGIKERVLWMINVPALAVVLRL